MKKIIIGAALLALSSQAGAITVELQAYNQRSSSGSISTLRWDGGPGCTNYAAHSNCIHPASVMAAKGITPSTAVWDWNPGTGVLSMTGDFNSASSIGSNAMAPMVIGDKVSNMTIDTVNGTTIASAYECVEGTFLAGVGANGCLNVDLGANFMLDSSAVYNVGGNANCVVRSIGGDDASMGNVRTLANTAGGGGCDAGDGAFNLWTVVSYTGPGGQLIVSNGIPITDAGTSYLTFSVAAVPVPGAVWLLGSALGLLGLVRRRIAA